MSAQVKTTEAKSLSQLKEFLGSNKPAANSHYAIDDYLHVIKSCHESHDLPNAMHYYSRGYQIAATASTVNLPKKPEKLEQFKKMGWQLLDDLPNYLSNECLSQLRLCDIKNISDFLKIAIVQLDMVSNEDYEEKLKTLQNRVKSRLNECHKSKQLSLIEVLSNMKDVIDKGLGGEVEDEEEQDDDIYIEPRNGVCGPYSENKEEMSEIDNLKQVNDAISKQSLATAIKLFNNSIAFNGSDRSKRIGRLNLGLTMIGLLDLKKYCLCDSDDNLNELISFIEYMIRYGDELVYQQRQMVNALSNLQDSAKRLIDTKEVQSDSAAFVGLCTIVSKLNKYVKNRKNSGLRKGGKSGVNKSKVIHNRNYLNVLKDSIQKGSIETAVELFNHQVAVDSLDLLKYGLKILNVLDVEQYYFSKEDPYLNELQKFVDYMIKHTGGSEVDCQKDIFESLMLVKDSITNFMATNQIETEGKRFGVLCVMIGKLNQYELTLKIFDNRVMADADKGDIEDQKYHNKENLFRLSNAMNSEIDGKSLANTRYKRPFGELEKDQLNMGINPSSFNHGSGNDDMSQSGTGVPPLAKKSRSMNGSKRASNEVGNNVHQGGNNDATISTLDKMQIQRNEPNRNELADRSQMDHAGVSIQNNNIGGTNLTTQNFGNNGHRYETQLQTTANHPINSYHIVSIKRLDVATNRWQQISGENKCGWNNNNMSRRSTIYTSNIIRYLHNDTYQFNVKTYQELKTIADKDEFVRTIMARHYGFHQS